MHNFQRFFEFYDSYECVLGSIQKVGESHVWGERRDWKISFFRQLIGHLQYFFCCLFLIYIFGPVPQSHYLLWLVIFLCSLFPGEEIINLVLWLYFQYIVYS
jgi:hypothetical protein